MRSACAAHTPLWASVLRRTLPSPSPLPAHGLCALARAVACRVGRSFTAAVAATLLRGVKSILQGRLLTEPEDKLDELTLLHHMAGCSIPPLGAYAALFEHAALYDPQLRAQGAARRWALVLLSGVVAFFLNLANFVVTKRTSAVSLQVLGNVKVVLSIGVSLLIFGNSVSAWSAAGCVITLGGVACYNRAPKA